MLKRTIGMITALILLFAFSACGRGIAAQAVQLKPHSRRKFHQRTKVRIFPLPGIRISLLCISRGREIPERWQTIYRKKQEAICWNFSPEQR